MSALNRLKDLVSRMRRDNMLSDKSCQKGSLRLCRSSALCSLKLVLGRVQCVTGLADLIELENGLNFLRGSHACLRQSADSRTQISAVEYASPPCAQEDIHEIHKKSGRLDGWNLPFASAIYREPTSAGDKIEDSFGGVP